MTLSRYKREHSSVYSPQWLRTCVSAHNYHGVTHSCNADGVNRIAAKKQMLRMHRFWWQMLVWRHWCLVYLMEPCVNLAENESKRYATFLTMTGLSNPFVFEYQRLRIVTSKTTSNKHEAHSLLRVLRPVLVVLSKDFYTCVKLTFSASRKA